MTPTETMPALLRRWSELEPERCFVIGPENKQAYMLRGLDVIDHLIRRPREPLGCALIQATVQQACLADDLYASLEINNDTISLCLEDPTSDGKIGGSAALEGRGTDTLARVWLMARIAYLESKQRAALTTTT